LGYTFWCSVNTPELLVAALHQALFIISDFAFHFNHSFLTSYLSLSLENKMALAEPSSFLQPYVYFTLADTAMPISPTHVAAGYPPL
jgi:hypothetical protein